MNGALRVEMSGLAAIIHTDGRPADPALIRRMTATMTHRGADGISHWCDGPAALGLCLTATTEGMRDAGLGRFAGDRRNITVMTGYLADRHRLASDLELAPEELASLPDPDLLLAAFRRWGLDCARHLRGGFAALIWDRRARSVVLIRDHLGQKPLHYHWDGRTLCVASDLAAILALPWVDALPDHSFAAELIANRVTSRTRTVWTGICRLPPAHCLTLGENGPRVHPYWSPLEAAEIRYRSEDEYAEHYLELLGGVARRHAESTHPLGCEVSGGLDSSALFTLAHRMRSDGCLPAPALHGFTLDFGDHPQANDLPYARSVASHLGVEIAEIAPFGPDLDGFARQARQLRDHPGYPNGAMSIGLMQAAVRSGCRAIMEGTGGDEWLTGSYATYTDAVRSGHLAVLAACLSADMAGSGFFRASRNLLRYGLFDHLPAPVRKRLKRTRDRWFRRRREIDWLEQGIAAELDARSAEWRADLSRCPTAAKTNFEAVRLDGATTFSIELSERLAAIHGLEPRSPMLDPDVVEFAYGTPGSLYWCGGPIKALHRQALGDLLPVAVRDRADKAEFSVVFERHLAIIPAKIWRDVGKRLVPLLSAEGLARLDSFVSDEPRSPAESWRMWELYAFALLFD